MPLSRDPRADRRRRVLMDTSDSADTTTPGGRTTRARRSVSSAPEEDRPRRGAGYSQEVRKACGQRLVQLIPVRKRSFAAAIFVSILVPTFLLVSHYMIYVSGSLPWYGHPLAVSFDASHPSSIASWFSSHLWLLCLGATVLTFQLRRHKLDDYEGEYRLWFWLVITCLIASIDATTHISDLFGLALDRWSQINLGWSGPAVVQATLAVLIGMLGLRLCTELKSVPTSLIFWLVGLVAWAGSAALGQEELRVDLSLQFRIWLKAALWLGGLTAVWLAALSYLRQVYVEAQRRFLLRSRLASSQGIPVGQRIRESMPNMPAAMARFRRSPQEGAAAEPREKRRWLPAFGRGEQEIDEHGETPRQKRQREKQELAALKVREREELAAERELQREETRQQKANNRNTSRKPEPDTAHERVAAAEDTAPRRGLGGFLRRPKSSSVDAEPKQANRQNSRESNPGGSRWTSWIKRPKHDDDAEEYRKVTDEESQAQPGSRRTASRNTDDEQAGSGGGWFSRFRRKSDSNSETEAKQEHSAKSQPKARRSEDDSDDSSGEKRGFFSRFKLPSFRLPPPEASGASSEGRGVSANGIRPVEAARPLPGTSRDDGSNQNADYDDDYDDRESRPLSKAERKRMRRQQQQDRAA